MRDRFTLFMDAAIAKQKRAEVAAPSAAPADCIREFPTLSPDTIELVAFDSLARPQIRVEIPKTEDADEWSRWLLRWVRRRERRTVKAGMRLI